jgi:hypothetical protein
MAYQRSIERRRYLTTRHFYTHTEIQNSVSHVVGNPTVENDYSPEAVFGRNGLVKVLGSVRGPARDLATAFF